MTETRVVTTTSAEETEKLGATVASFLGPGAVVALRGELASGKTCFVRGMASAFGAAAAVHSPTFTLVNEYATTPRLYHADLYRLSGPADLIELGYEELFDSDGICAVEWAERAEGLLPPARLDVLLEHAGDDRRRITLSDLGVLRPGWSQEIGVAL